MATPTYATALLQITTYIVANGNNEITANVLSPVLKSMLDFANNNIGDLSTLTTDQKNTVVDAINSLKYAFDNLNNNGVQLYTGIDDPNINPPPTYTYADFYMQIDINDLPVKLWQWNGFEWTDASEEPSTTSDNVQNNSDVPGSSVTQALNNLLSGGSNFPKIQIIATAGQTIFPLGTKALANGVLLNGLGINDEDWSQSGSNITTTFPLNEEDIFKPF